MYFPPFYAYACAVLGGYLLGSAPWGLILGRVFGLGDLRKIGSGNIGATNMWRAGRKDLAIATFLLDSSKAGLALLLASWLFGRNFGLAAGFAALLGHCFPIWLRFKGGKGVSSFFGILLAGLPLIGLGAGLVWLMMAFTFRFSSLSALAAAALAPIFALALHHSQLDIAYCAGMGLLIFWLHRANIARLIQGKEPKIGGPKTA